MEFEAFGAVALKSSNVRFQFTPFRQILIKTCSRVDQTCHLWIEAKRFTVRIVQFEKHTDTFNRDNRHEHNSFEHAVVKRGAL